MPRVSNWFFIVAFIVLAAAIVGWMSIDAETWSRSPGGEGDDIYFENIAWHLARNEGVKFDFSREQWQQLWRDDNVAGDRNWVSALNVRGLTTSRSPGFPFFAAAIYRILGHNWTAVRVAQVLLMALSLAILVTGVFQSAGSIAGWICLATLAADYFVLRSAGQFMSEALGVCAVSLLFVACWKSSTPPNDNRRVLDYRWLLIGMLFGIGTLIRANLNAWLLLIVAAAPVAVVIRLALRKPIKAVIGGGMLFVVGIVIVASPWWIRNCWLTGGFAPFGTSGSFGLSGAWCDEAYDNFGNWSESVTIESQNRTLKRPGIFDMTLPQQELLMGQDGTAQAARWIKANPAKVPIMIGMRAYSHLGFHRQPVALIVINALLYFGAIIGCYATRKELGFWVFIFVGLSLVSTMLTWPHFGRYSIPIRPLIHAASAVGTVVFWRWILSFKSKSRGAQATGRV